MGTLPGRWRLDTPPLCSNPVLLWGLSETAEVLTQEKCSWGEV